MRKDWHKGGWHEYDYKPNGELKGGVMGYGAIWVPWVVREEDMPIVTLGDAPNLFSAARAVQREVYRTS